MQTRCGRTSPMTGCFRAAAMIFSSPSRWGSARGPLRRRA
jgi:hypothetical protein